MDETFVKFVHRFNDQVLYAKIEDVINLEHKHKKFLWDIPKETFLKTYILNGEKYKNFKEISLENLQMTIRINNPNFTIEHIQE